MKRQILNIGKYIVKSKENISIRFPRNSKIQEDIKVVIDDFDIKNISVVLEEGVEVKSLKFIKRKGNKNINITIGKSASLSFVFEQSAEKILDVIDTINVFVGEKGCINTFINTTTEKKLSCSYVSKINKSAESNLSWIFQARNKQELDLYCENIFQDKNSSGNIETKGVVSDNAKIKLKGIISISRNGSRTDAGLKEEILLLDSTAKAEAIPKLIIDTNDVKANHSVAISNINKEQLFYFFSRGINEVKAKKMIVAGFLKK